MAVEVQEIEGKHDGVASRQRPTPTAKQVLQLAEVRAPLLVENDCLAVKDGGPDAEAFGGILDAREPMRPIMPASGENTDMTIVQVDGDPIPVPLELIKPIRPDRWTRLQERETRFDPVRHWIERKSRLR